MSVREGKAGLAVRSADFRNLAGTDFRQQVLERTSFVIRSNSPSGLNADAGNQTKLSNIRMLAVWIHGTGSHTTSRRVRSPHAVRI